MEFSNSTPYLREFAMEYLGNLRFVFSFNFEISQLTLYFIFIFTKAEHRLDIVENFKTN